MSGLTRRNVANDLNISPYKFEVAYPDTRMIYVFSSMFYLNKFKDGLSENRNKVNESLSNRFGFSIKAEKIADIRLYSAIEKRGFLIYHDKGKVECLRSITLDGLMLIQKN